MSALSNIPRLLRAVLQSLRVGDLCEEELPQLGQILSMMLQHAPLRSHLLANTSLLQHVIQELTVHSGAQGTYWSFSFLLITSFDILFV